ncbi:MAG: hypothetical protein JWO36_6635 [Myxococcales bacterium]|nr:hypothetical protein [Myxococcales bacterium]
MAISRCPRPDCSSVSFEAMELVPKGSTFRLMAIQCAHCGSVVGVQEIFNVAHLVKQLAHKMRIALD